VRCAKCKSPYWDRQKPESVFCKVEEVPAAKEILEANFPDKREPLWKEKNRVKGPKDTKSRFQSLPVLGEK
jgi:hypothetical protein